MNLVKCDKRIVRLIVFNLLK